MRGDGRIFQRGPRFWIEYWDRGLQHRESGGRTEAEARRRLKARLREIAGGRFLGPQEERITVEQMLDDLTSHLRTKGAKAIGALTSHMKPLRAFFGLRRAVEVTSPMVDGYVQQRLAEGKARATVNREVQPLSRRSA